MNVQGNKRLTGRIAAEHIKLMSVPRLPAGVIERLAALGDASGLISDTMDELGIPCGVIGASVLRPSIPGIRELQFEGFLLHAPDTLGEVSTQEWQNTFRAEFHNGAYTDDDIVDNQQPTPVGSLNHVLQVPERAPMRVHGVKIASGIAMKLALGVQDYRGNPNGSRPERLDVVQFLLEALEIAAMHGPCAAGVVVTVGVVIGRVTVEKAVGYDLVDVLGLPECVGKGLRARLPVMK